MTRVLVVGHDAAAGLGPLGPALRRRGLQLEPITVVPLDRHHRPDVAVSFPEPEDHDAVLTLGAPWPRQAIEAWVPDEIGHLQAVLASGRPVVGICFGAQLLAEALGGGVVDLAAPRVGWYPVHSDHPDIGAGPWFQWHAQQLVPPAGAQVLASSADGCEVFAQGSALGLQLHPEMDRALLRRWLAMPGQHPYGARAATLRAETARVTGRAWRARVNRIADLLADRLRGTA